MLTGGSEWAVQPCSGVDGELRRQVAERSSGTAAVVVLPGLLNGRRGPCGPCVGGPGIRELQGSPAAAIAGKSVYLRGRSPAQNPYAQGSKPWMVAAVTLLAPRWSSYGGFDGGGGLGVRDHGGAEDLCGVATLSEGGG